MHFSHIPGDVIESDWTMFKVYNVEASVKDCGQNVTATSEPAGGNQR